MDANKGRLISVEDDVLSIKKQIEEIWGLQVYFDNVDERWVVVQTDYDGTESLVCTTDRLDHSLLDTIQAADQTVKGFDPEKQVDDWNAAIEAERDRRFEEQLEEFAERFRFALKKDGVYNHNDIGNQVGKTLDQRRVIRSRSN